MINRSRHLLSMIFVFFLIGCTSVPDVSEHSLLDCNTRRYPAKYRNKELFYAVKSGDVTLVKEILGSFWCKANINVSDWLGQSALMWACWNGDETMVQTLLRIDSVKRFGKSDYQRKHWRRLDFTAESNEKYRPLFCLIMSNTMSTGSSIRCMRMFLRNEKRVMDEKIRKYTTNISFIDKLVRQWVYGKSSLLQTDYYGETVLHKAVRSGRIEYLRFLLRNLEKLPIINKHGGIICLDKKNYSGDTPLTLAVRLQESEMVKYLIAKGADITVRDADNQTLAEAAFADGNGDYVTFLEVMKANLRKAVDNSSDTDQKVYRGSLIGNLEKHLDAVRGAGTYKDLAYFDSVLLKYTGLVDNPEELDDNNYKETKKQFFSILGKSDIVMQDINKIGEMLQKSRYLINSCHPQTYKSALQMCIENGNIDLFDTVFRCLNMNMVRQPSDGCSDYLVCAIVNNRLNIIKYLLDYYDKNSGVLTGNLMKPRGRILGDAFQRYGTGNPLEFYIKNKNYQSDEVLFERLLTFYKPFYNNTPAAITEIYNAAVSCDDEDLLLKLYECSNVDSTFYAVDTVTVNGQKRPVQHVLLERKYYSALLKYIDTNIFTKIKYDYNDDKKTKKSFQELLEEKLSDNNPDVQKIVDILKKKGLWEEKEVEPSEEEDITSIIEYNR